MLDSAFFQGLSLVQAGFLLRGCVLDCFLTVDLYWSVLVSGVDCLVEYVFFSVDVFLVACLFRSSFKCRACRTWCFL